MSRRVSLSISIVALAFAVCVYASPATAQSLRELVNANQTNLAKLQVGMSKAAVLKLMGTAEAQTRDGAVRNPFRSEMFVASGAQVEVLSYVTRVNRKFAPIGDAELTPVILRDGKVVGWGRQALRRLKNPHWY